MTRLTGELAELFAKSHDLEDESGGDWGQLGMSSSKCIEKLSTLSRNKMVEQFSNKNC